MRGDLAVRAKPLGMLPYERDPSQMLFGILLSPSVKLQCLECGSILHVNMSESGSQKFSFISSRRAGKLPLLLVQAEVKTC